MMNVLLANNLFIQTTPVMTPVRFDTTKLVSLTVYISTAYESFVTNFKFKGSSSKPRGFKMVSSIEWRRFHTLPLSDFIV